MKSEWKCGSWTASPGNTRLGLGEEHYKSWPSDPQWSPTGRQIAFQMNFRREYEVWLLKDFLP